MNQIKSYLLFAFLFMCILFGQNAFGGHQYHDFRLGKHSIEGNEIEFTFPSPPPTKTLYMFNYHWKPKELFKKARLVVILYDKNKKMIAAGESIWINMRKKSSHMDDVTFGSIAIQGISRGNIEKVAYFSLYLQKAPDKSSLSLDDNKPEVYFAKKVIAAIKQGENAYIGLFAGQPLSPSQRKKAEGEYRLMMSLLTKDLGLRTVLKMPPSQAVRLRYPCSDPYNMEFGPQFKQSENVNGAQTSMSVTLSLPIGKTKGEWRILFPE